MDYSLPPPKAVSRLYIFPPAGHYTPKQIQLIFQSITARLPVRRSNTIILQISSTAYSQVPILQVGGLRKMWINCFPKAATTCVVVGIEPATAGSQVRRPNHTATLLHKKKLIQPGALPDQYLYHPPPPPLNHRASALRAAHYLSLHTQASSRDSPATSTHSPRQC
ncbi:hypothetical protein ElyMa_006255100 [Elysia marginata]|uniref:Uncharacterized protein n=1 Tax=Elysia marginata TaxID=1093978 RepID=A0AAV4HC84_9GAST|nr:hypothetical protein ElyMa_006255100 [Elysia marginata]